MKRPSASGIDLLNLALLPLLLFTVACAGKRTEKAAQKPNVIVIVSDDAGYADFGVYGGTEIPTPAINSIGEEGVVFTNAYVSASVCAPSRAGLLTGRYQQRFGFEHNLSTNPAKGFSQTDVGLDPDERTVADEMKANGYKTIAIGKWHLGYDEKHFPLNRGFDQFYGFLQGSRSFFPYTKLSARKEGQALLANRQEVPEDSITYLTDMLTQKATSFIKENKSAPFFMYLSYNAVHTPMNAQKDQMAKFAHIKDKDRRAYAAMMASLDEGVGKMLAALEQNGLEENTLVIFINDNGGATNNASDNGPMRGMKGSKWEGGVRVAFLMKWPAKLQGKHQFHQPVSSLDILPTSLAAANAPQTGSKKLDGVNLLPYLTKEVKGQPHEALFWKRGVAAAVREGKWKLIRVTSNPVLLFNLETDVSETRNLATQEPQLVERLLGKLAAWEKDLSAPRWTSAYDDQNQVLKHRMDVIGRDQERRYP
ncbi:MAG: sulfatase [Rufibacter sp.]